MWDNLGITAGVWTMKIKRPGIYNTTRKEKLHIIVQKHFVAFEKILKLPKVGSKESFLKEI